MPKIQINRNYDKNANNSEKNEIKSVFMKSVTLLTSSDARKSSQPKAKAADKMIKDIQNSLSNLDSLCFRS